MQQTDSHRVHQGKQDGHILLAIIIGLTYIFCGMSLRGTRTASAAEVTNYEWEWTESEQKKLQRLEKKIKQDDDGFYEYEEKDFIVRSDISQRFVAELTLYMDSFVEAFPDVFPVPPKGTVMVKLTVTVYKNKEEYLDSAPGIPHWSGGVFYPDWSKPGWPTWNVRSYPWTAEGEDFAYFNRPVLQHEGAHAMFQKFTGKKPIEVFFTEGVATYFEWWNLREDVKENQAERDKRTYRWRVLRRKYTQDPEFKPSLEEYLTMEHETWGEGPDSEISLRYALAESFVSFLLSSSKGRSKFRDMVEEMYKGHPLLKDKQYKRMEKDWHEYIQTVLLPLAPQQYNIGTGENKAADRSFAIGFLIGKSVLDAFKKLPGFDAENKADVDDKLEAVADTIKNVIAPEESSKKKSKRAKKKNDTEEKESAVIGTTIGEALKAGDKEVNLYYLQRGIEDGVAGETQEVASEERLKSLLDEFRETAEPISKKISEITIEAEPAS